MRKVETMEQWNKLSARLKEKGYKPRQYQFDWFEPEGFHVWFGKDGKEDYEVVTFKKEIQAAIIDFNSK